LFLLNFKNIDPNKKDIHNKLPIDYLIDILHQDNDHNREMFLLLASKTKFEDLSEKDMLVRMNSWQMSAFENHIEQKNVNMICS